MIIFCVIWSIVWYDTKQEMEKKFQNGVDQFGFQDNTSENFEEEDYQYPYRLEDSSGVTFLLTSPVMSDWVDISFLGFFNQILVCRVQREDSLIHLEWYGSESDFVTVYIYDGTGKKRLSDQQAKKLLRDDEQMKEINEKALEMCQALYTDYKWHIGE